MQSHTHSQPRKLIQLPNLIVILYEANEEPDRSSLMVVPRLRPTRSRGGGATPAADGTATRSLSRYNFRDGGWLDVNGAPLTSEGRLIEGSRPNVGTLEIDVTIDNPKAYTRPWTVRVNQRLLPDTDLIEFVCLENNQFDPATGSQRRR